MSEQKPNAGRAVVPSPAESGQSGATGRSAQRAVTTAAPQAVQPRDTFAHPVYAGSGSDFDFMRDMQQAMVNDRQKSSFLLLVLMVALLMSAAIWAHYSKLEEIAMDQDDPTDVAFENFVEQLMGQNPLGRPIGGTPQEIMQVPRDAVWEHYKKYYTPDRLVISAAGSLEHSHIVNLVLDALTRYGWNLLEGVVPVPRRVRTESGIVPFSKLHEVQKGFEQTNIVMGCPSIIAGDERRYAMSVLSSAFGSGMSSRLFQEIREKRGLAYSTFAFSGAYSDAGYFGMYAGCLPAKTEQVCELLQYEFDKLVSAGITEEELSKVRGQLVGSTVLGSEDSGSRMSRLGRAELDSGKFTSTDELLEKIRAVTLDDVHDLARYLGEQQMITTIVR